MEKEEAGLMDRAQPYDPWDDVPHAEIVREIERLKCGLHLAFEMETLSRGIMDSGPIRRLAAELSAKKATALAASYWELAAALKEEVDREPVQW